MQSTLFTKLSSLLMPDDFRVWSPDKPLYKDLNIHKDDLPELISLVANVTLFESELEEELWIPVHAWRILYEIEATSSVDTLISLFDKYHNCDYASEELYKIVALLSKGSRLKELSEHLHDKSKYMSSRCIALNAIEYTANKYGSYESQCIDILASCLNKSDGNWRTFNGLIVASLASLKAASKIDVIKKAFNDDIIELFIAGDLEDVEISLGLRKKRDTPTRKYFLERFAGLFSDDPYNGESDASRARKIGRNDKCPCGSGKKYKKCCIDLTL